MNSGLRYGVEVRSALPADAPDLARLLAVGGTVASPRDVLQRLDAVRAHGHAAILVATGYAGLSGLVALHWSPMLHEARSVARITLLLVDGEERRRGIGRLLLKSASQAARNAACDTIEMAVPDGQAAAAAFCRNTGFLPQGMLFSQVLRKKA